MENELLGGIRADLSNEDSMVCLPLDRLDEILLKEFEGQETAEVLWEYRVVGVEQDGGEARVRVETREGELVLGADYVVGCDGANSIVRRSVYGDEFPGITLDSQIIATNVSTALTFHFTRWTLNISRSTTISTNSTTGILNSFLTPKTGSWLRKSLKMECGESHMAIHQVSRTKNISHDNQCVTNKSFQANPNQEITS